MRIEVNPSPIIVTGMHRSGTTLVTRGIMELDVFFGKDLDRNLESNHFKKLNNNLLRDLGGSWDNPNVANALLEDELLAQCYVELFETCGKEGIGLNYFGPRNMIKKPKVWGWKDPRACFTMDIWKKVFPASKIVLIKRHGLDVAFSLMERRSEYLIHNHLKFRKYKSLYSMFGKRGSFTDSARCSSILNSLSLWAEYNKQMDIIQKRYSGDCIEIEYEDFVSNSINVLGTLSSFLDLDVPELNASGYLSSIDKKRKNAYLNKLSQIECMRGKDRDLVESILARYGYEI